MVNVIVKLTEDDINLLRHLLVNEIQDLEFDKERCSHIHHQHNIDFDFDFIRQNLDSRIEHANNLCTKICKSYNEVVSDGKR